MIVRRKTKQIKVGSVPVGSDAPISIQSMTKTDTRDIKATNEEILRLYKAGCDIVRLAVPDMQAAEALKEICISSPIPVIADIHFDHQLALQAIKSSVDGLRINPGNIRSQEKIREIAAAAKDCQIPIRVGVNSGSLDPELKSKYGKVTAQALADSALKEAELLEKFNFDLIKIAVKAFDLPTMIEAVEIVAKRCDYPLHLGVTESGLPQFGIVRSSIGIGHLLLKGIGDTIRVSLTSDSVKEIETAHNILQSLNIKYTSPVIISCPTCGRCEIPLEKIAKEVAEKVRNIKKNYHIAVMGCAVNGPGEAEQADFGIAGGKESGLIFSKGKIIRTLPTEKLVEGLITEIKKANEDI